MIRGFEAIEVVEGINIFAVAESRLRAVSVKAVLIVSSLLLGSDVLALDKGIERQNFVYVLELLAGMHAVCG